MKEGAVNISDAGDAPIADGLLEDLAAIEHDAHVWSALLKS